MILSIMLMGALSVAVYALPALPNTFSTSGTDIMSLSCTCKIRLASLFDTSGRVTGMNNNEPSSKGGINSEPKRRTKGILPNTIRTETAMTVFFQRWQRRKTGLYIFIKKLATGFLLSGMSFPFINERSNMGTMKRATMAEPIMVNVFVQTKGANNFFSCPSKNKMGANEMSVTRMEKYTARPTVRDERSIIVIRSSSLSSFVLPTLCFSIIRLFLKLRSPNFCKHSLS